MIGFVLVSHSQKVAEGLKQYLEVMNNGRIVIEEAGGADEGRMGTNTLKIHKAIEKIYDHDPIFVFIDLGSAVLSTEMALDLLDEDVRKNVHIIDTPIIEGSILGLQSILSGKSIATILEELIQLRSASKLV